jgi:hypothetical protein
MSVPPPYYPYPPPSPGPRRRRLRLRLRVPWVLTDDAFWTGVLTALSVAGLLVMIVATS